MPKGKLTPKQERFVQEYLIDLNATQAAIRAGYSEKTAQEQGSRLLSNAMVRAAVDAKRARLADKYEVTAERVIRELALIGFANMIDYIHTDSEGRAYPDLSNLSRDQAAAIQEVTCETVMEHDPDGEADSKRAVTKMKFKLSDKRAALVDLGKHLGLFESDAGEALRDGIAALIQSGRKRAATQDEARSESFSGPRTRTRGGPRQLHS